MKRNFISSEMSYKTYLKQLYFDREKPGSYGSVNKLCRAVRKEGKYVLGPIQPTKPTPADCTACATSNGDIE